MQVDRWLQVFEIACIHYDGRELRFWFQPILFQVPNLDPRQTA